MSKQKAAALEKLSKSKYNAKYLGWKECSGLYGVEMTGPVIHDMIYGPRPDDFKFDELPRVVMSLSRKELKITQTVTKKPGKTETIKFHVIPTKDLMFASRGTSPDDCVIACVYLGFNPSTKSYTHVHAYLCDTSAEAETLMRHIYQYIDTPYHRDRLVKIEREMVKKGHIQARAGPSDGSPYDEMGFPKTLDAKTNGPQTNGTTAPVVASTPDYSIYGTASDFIDGTQHRTPGEQQDDNQSLYQKYLLSNAAGGPLRLPRASPRSSTADAIDPSPHGEHARLGYTRSNDSGSGPLPQSNYPRSEFAALSLGDNQSRYLQQPAGDQRSASPSINGAYPVGHGDASAQRQVSGDPYHRGAAVTDDCPPDYDDGAESHQTVVETALAAELRQRLGRGGPILLPPKDYDTINRTRGNLIGIETRRCLNERIIGKGEGGGGDEGAADPRAAQFDWRGKRPGVNGLGFK